MLLPVVVVVVMVWVVLLLDAAADVAAVAASPTYRQALGCVLYELCTLRKAFDGQSLPALVSDRGGGIKIV